MNHWNQIIIEIEQADNIVLDQISNNLFELGATGTEIKDAPDYLNNVENLFGEIPLEIPEDQFDRPVQLIAYFDDELPDLEDCHDYIKENFPQLSYTVSKGQIANEEWQLNWMDNYQIERLTRHVVIVPEWKDYSPNFNESVIRLDPGVAFGTGNHPTTQLGAQCLEIVMKGNERVLDVGTGTGILSFIAGALGAISVEGYDLDPQAVTSAKQNLALQKDSHIQTLIDREAIIFDVNNLMQNLKGPFDIIVANILPHILVDMLDDAYRELTANGYLILGGILSEKSPEIESALNEHLFSINQKIQLGDWVGYIATKR